MNIETLLDDEQTEKILQHMFKYPVPPKFSKREIAKATGVPRSTAVRRINNLVEQNILIEKTPVQGTKHVITRNDDHAMAEDLQEYFDEPEPEQSYEPITLQELESYLWEAADILRGSIDSSDYKNYIFGLLFLKRINDRFKEKAEELQHEHPNIPRKEYEQPDHHDIYVPERARWNHIQNQTENIGESINIAFEALEDHEKNPITNRVLTAIDFNDKDRLPDAVLEELITHFSKKRFRNKDLEDPDIFGRAYEYLIRQFADDAGKKGGEFYTPREVVKILVEILDPQPGHTVYDPCCGSGGMLIYSAAHLKDQGENPHDITLFGQEKNLNTWAIGEMNMLLHGYADAQIERGDTMLSPAFKTESDALRRFDRVIANPMWNQKKWGKDDLKDDPHQRFTYGIPPKNSADWAWIQHMLSSTTVNGKVGVVMDNGLLFRSRSEGKIRKKVLEDDLVEAVIALPKNLFANTSSPGCIMVLNKDKPKAREGKVLFIYAEDQELRETGVKMFKELSNQNQLTEEGLQKLIETYRDAVEEPHHSRLVDLEEIEENNWNLNVPRYVDTTEPEEDIDVTEAWKELKEAEQERDTVRVEVESYIKELGYED